MERWWWIGVELFILCRLSKLDGKGISSPPFSFFTTISMHFRKKYLHSSSASLYKRFISAERTYWVKRIFITQLSYDLSIPSANIYHSFSWLILFFVKYAVNSFFYFFKKKVKIYYFNKFWIFLRNPNIWSSCSYDYCYWDLAVMLLFCFILSHTINHVVACLASILIRRIQHITLKLFALNGIQILHFLNFFLESMHL